MYNVQQTVDQLYKKQYGKMIAMLLYCFRDMDIETAEDIVQDTFSSALTSWTADNAPFNADGWLFKVCRNKALNKIKTARRIHPLTEREDFNEEEFVFTESSVNDHQLKLLFACAHPDLSPKVQVVITLKYVISLKVEAIAKTVYGAKGVDFAPKALKQIQQFEANGWDHLPICMAKTQYSLSDDQTKLGRPTDFKITVREFRPSLGAGFLVALTGSIMTMPGLPKKPAALNMDIDENGHALGIF